MSLNGSLLQWLTGPVWLPAAGTVISDVQTDVDRTGPVMVKGFATIDNVALINVEGTGMVGVQGTASAIFSTVRDANANVIMISQASSEHSVCFAVKQAEGDRAVNALNARCAGATTWPVEAVTLVEKRMPATQLLWSSFEGCMLVPPLQVCGNNFCHCMKVTFMIGSLATVASSVIPCIAR